MATCDACGEHENMPYNCRHCGGTFCADHRLPENHNCPGLESWNDPDKVFDSGFDGSVQAGGSGGRSPGLLERLGIDTGPGGPLAYFRNNVSYLFLAIIVVVFGLQWLIAPLFMALPPEGVNPGHFLWGQIFTLTTVHPEYVWTWVISVFSHGSPMHLLFNAIVLYFFGPLVERQIGSKKFVGLFLASGIIAGLGQVGVGLVTSEGVAVLGASGALMAIMGVLAITSPDLKVLLFFFIPMSIRTLTILFAAFSIFAFVSDGGILDGVAHFAHLVGLLIGLWYGNRIKDRVGGGPRQLNLGPGRGGGGPGGPGRFP
ncbi:rhomboid family protease [Natronomonas pharaonis DSM 2160]|uniref:Rhomboid family protease n=1 Tax=Natronomonas pharaonis (strain ATCC 35678 / DSM 2160 / CIP 103997 / JCM 8858 / NBRC 14720 / NCIMB 2260 / Gabara) TaxID=348780 RepID=A0A1U7EUM1_NATPD|nr:rhomboid family intramembrane serine protease [Natronomonas pharaonis]CAI48669.1 rhomboid family protease [Natronomonas pharaonis DSM 2160]